MGEREPQRETIGRGELLCLYHPHTRDTFSGYGLTVMPNRSDRLVGLLMVDRPNGADPAWLLELEAIYGDCLLVPMTADGDRGLVCQMCIYPDSLHLLRRLPPLLSQFESFLNVGERDQLQVLTKLTVQEELHLAFYGDNLNYRFTTTIRHTEQQWQQLDEMISTALDIWQQLPPARRDFDQAKADFMFQHP